MGLPLQRPSWVALVCVGLVPAVGAASFAAEAPPAQPRSAKFSSKPALAVPASGPASPQPAAGGRSLIRALSDALGGGGDRNVRNQPRADARQVADDANVRNLEAQVRPQFQQLLYVELALVRRACNVDAKAFVEIAKGANAGLRVAVREYAVSQNTRMRGRIVVQGRVEQVQDTIDPRAQVQRVLLPLVESKLGHDQAERYRQECDKGAESRKRAVVLNLVALLDERLVLSAEQRAGLVQSLSSNYQNAWDQHLQMFAQNVKYLPSIRDEAIVPLLNEKQKSVWREVPKLSAGAFWGVPFARARIAGEAAELQEIARIVEEAQDDQ